MASPWCSMSHFEPLSLSFSWVGSGMVHGVPASSTDRPAGRSRPDVARAISLTIIPDAGSARNERSFAPGGTRARIR